MPQTLQIMKAATGTDVLALGNAKIPRLEPSSVCCRHMMLLPTHTSYKLYECTFV